MIYFTRQEQRIIILLGVVILLGTGVLLIKRFQPGWIMRLSMGKPDFDVEEGQKSPRLEGGASASTDQPAEEGQPDQERRSDTAAEAAREKVKVNISKVNINTASREELESLPRIGPALSQRIIDYRQKHGTFKSIDELMNVSGIGNATLQRLRDSITVGNQDKSD